MTGRWKYEGFVGWVPATDADYVSTAPTFSNDEYDADLGLDPAPWVEPCTCLVGDEWFPEHCANPEHHPKGEVA